MKILKIAGIIIGVILILILATWMYLRFYLKPMMEIKPATSHLQPSDYFDKNMVDSIVKYSYKNARNSANIAIAIVDNGTVNYYGLKREKNVLLNIDNKNSLYQIGSISKVFTSTLLANFVVGNELNIDEPIDKYIGFPLYKDLKLTWKSLSNHTSGLARLPDGAIINTIKNLENPYVDYSDTWMLDYLKNKITIDKDKKRKSEYSNLGAAVLGNALALYKKQSYEQLLQTYIFDKYKMPHSFVYKFGDKEKLVTSYNFEDSLTINWELKSFSPAGGIVSSVEDLSQFVLAQLDSNNRELAYTHIPTTNIEYNMRIGLAWHLLKTDQNRRISFHNGATGNFRSSMVIDLDSKKGAIILSNIDNSDCRENLDKLSLGLLEYINQKK